MNSGDNSSFWNTLDSFLRPQAQKPSASSLPNPTSSQNELNNRKYEFNYY